MSKLLKRPLLSKRQLFGIVTFFAVVALVATQLVATAEYYLSFAIGLSVFVGILSGAVLWKSAGGFRRYSSIILIVYYTIAVYFFYVLLPVRWLTRLPVALMFGIGYYAILLTENIYNVATGRSIQLLRVARSVGLLMTLVTVYLLLETVISLHRSWYINGILYFVAVFPLIFQNLWSVELSLKLNHELFFDSIILGLVIAETGLALSFWPGISTLQVLFLTSLFYSLVGIYQLRLLDRLFYKTVREFIIITVIVFMMVLLTTSWSG
jgi:hypothetical protein